MSDPYDTTEGSPIEFGLGKAAQKIFEDHSRRLAAMTKAITSTTSAGASGAFSGQLVGIGKAQLETQKDMSRLLSKIALQLAKGTQLATMNKQMQAVNKLHNQQQNIMKGMNALGPGRGSGGVGTKDTWFSKLTDFFKDLPGKIMSGIKGGMKIMSKIWEKTGGALFKKTGSMGINKLLGLGGVSVIGALVGKMIASSPLLQAMFKIMNTSLTLILRPIGDFFGAFLRPMSIYFLKELAIPFFQQNKSMMKMGEQWGKTALGFFINPGKAIQSSIILAAGSLDIPGIGSIMSKETMKDAKWFQEDPAAYMRWQEGISKDGKWEVNPATGEISPGYFDLEKNPEGPGEYEEWLHGAGLNPNNNVLPGDPLFPQYKKPVDVTVTNPDDIGGDTITVVTQGGGGVITSGGGILAESDNPWEQAEGWLPGLSTSLNVNAGRENLPPGFIGPPEAPPEKPPKKDFWGDAWDATLKFFTNWSVLPSVSAEMEDDVVGMAGNMENSKEQTEYVEEYSNEIADLHERAATTLEKTIYNNEGTMSTLNLLNHRITQDYGRTSEQLHRSSEDIIEKAFALKLAYEAIVKNTDDAAVFSGLEVEARKFNNELNLGMTEAQLDFVNINKSKIQDGIKIWDTVIYDLMKWQQANSHTQFTMFNTQAKVANDFIKALTGEAGTVGTIDMSVYGSGTTAGNIMSGTGSNNPLLAMAQQYSSDYGSGATPNLEYTPYGTKATVEGMTGTQEFSHWVGPEGNVVTSLGQVPKITNAEGKHVPAPGWKQVANMSDAITAGLAYSTQAGEAIANAAQSAHISSYLSASKTFSQAQSVAYVKAGGGEPGMEAATAVGEAEAAAAEAATNNTTSGGGGYSSSTGYTGGTKSPTGVGGPSSIGGTWGGQFGGIIDEPMIGMGLHSGKTMTLGESGKELVTPIGDLSQRGGGVNILNINIGSITKEADYQKLKPYVQRWILETSSRRGTV